MSPVNQFYEWLFADIDELIDCSFNESEGEKEDDSNRGTKQD